MLVNVWNRAETLIAFLLLAACLLHTGQMIEKMATTSLTTDEFGSVGAYSARGPLRAVTDYRAPKNHIFFSLLNSVLPGRASLNPARARMLSILAAALFVAALVGYSVSRGAFFEGTVVLTLWTFSSESLQLCIQARGYGFLALAALVSSICVAEYLRTDRRGWLQAAAIAVVLGAYTVPGFLFFGGPLLLLVWATRRNKLSFSVGVIAALAIALLYSPTIFQVLDVFQKYSSLYDSDFKEVHSLVRAAKLYLFSSPDWAVFVFLIALCIAPFAADERLDRSESRGRKVVMAAALIFFTILLYIRSGPIRMANMGVVPFAFAGIFAWGATIRILPVAVRAACFAAVGVFLAMRIAPEVRDFHFVPHEDWSLAGTVVDNAFDPGIRLDFARYAKYLGHTIREPEKRSSQFDEQAYVSGSLVVADATNKWSVKWPEGRRFFRPEGELHNAQIVIPGETRDIVLTFMIPKSDQFAGTPAELTDRDSKTGVSLSSGPLIVKTVPTKDLQAFVFLLNHAIDRSAMRVSIVDLADGADRSKDAIHAGNAIIFPVKGPAGVARRFQFKFTSNDPSLLVVEAWPTFQRNR